MAQDNYVDNNGSPVDSEAPPVDWTPRKTAIESFYKRYLGRDADADGLNGWLYGGMGLGDVENAIKNSDEAKKWVAGQASPSSPYQPNAASTATQDWTQGPWDANRVRSYFSSRGVTPFATSADYWAQKWQEWGSKDPAYFLDRLKYADEFLPGQNPANSPYAGAAGGGGGSTHSGSVTAGGLTPEQQAMQAQLYKTLMERITQSLKIDRNDPIIRGQADAYSANQERSRRNFLSDLAEQSSPYATGTQLGQQRMTSEKVGQANGAFETQLLGRELESRRSEITQSLQQMGSLLTSQQQMALQKELALLDDATRKLQLQQSNSQFYANLGFNVEQQQAYWNAVNSGLIR